MQDDIYKIDIQTRLEVEHKIAQAQRHIPTLVLIKELFKALAGYCYVMMVSIDGLMLYFAVKYGRPRLQSALIFNALCLVLIALFMLVALLIWVRTLRYLRVITDLKQALLGMHFR